MLRSLHMPYSAAIVRIYEKALTSRKFWLATKVLALLPKTSVQAAFVVTVKFGTEALVKKLILKGAKIDTSSLLLEARNSPVDSTPKMRALVRAGLDVNGFIGPKRLKLINYAIFNRDEELFRFLLNQGVDLQIADRNDLLPLQAALLVEEKAFEKTLLSQGAAESASPLLRILESLVINENLLFSELHELLKWCFKNSGFELARTTFPSPNLFRYRICHNERDYRVELKFILAEEITLLLFKGEEILPLMSLLPTSGKIDSKTLRGHVVTELKELLKGAEDHSYRRTTQKPPSTQEEKALQILGLKKGADEREIISAYRSLAKKYHPDVSKKGSHEMIHLNGAYETLRKK